MSRWGAWELSDLGFNTSLTEPVPYAILLGILCSFDHFLDLGTWQLQAFARGYMLVPFTES